MNHLKIKTSPDWPHIRTMWLDTSILLTYLPDENELKVSTTITGDNATLLLEKKVMVNDLLHRTRTSREEHTFPVLCNELSSFYLSFDELNGYLVTCKLCDIEPDRIICDKVKESEA